MRETGVEFAFVDVLAADAHAVPLVLVDGPVRFPGDAAALREAIHLGTRVVRTEADGEDVGEVDPAALHAPTRRATAPLVARCLDLVRSSRAILRLPHDPLEVVEARRDGDDVVVRFRDPPAAAALHDLDDRVVATAAVAPTAPSASAAPTPPSTPSATGSSSRPRPASAGAPRRRSPTSSASPNAASSPADVAEVGAPFAPRVLVVNSKTGLPVAGVAGPPRAPPGRSRPRRGRPRRPTPHGTVTRALVVPEDAAEGPAALLVDDQRFAIHVRSGVKLSVVVDRPLYRPDDEVHVRLMAHRAAAGTPVAALEVRR